MNALVTNYKTAVEELKRLERRNALTIEVTIIRDDIRIHHTVPAKCNTLVDDLEKLVNLTVKNFVNQLREQSDAFEKLPEIQTRKKNNS